MISLTSIVLSDRKQLQRQYLSPPSQLLSYQRMAKERTLRSLSKNDLRFLLGLPPLSITSMQFLCSAKSGGFYFMLIMALVQTNGSLGYASALPNLTPSLAQNERVNSSQSTMRKTLPQKSISMPTLRSFQVQDQIDYGLGTKWRFKNIPCGIPEFGILASKI